MPTPACVVDHPALRGTGGLNRFDRVNDDPVFSADVETSSGATVIHVRGEIDLVTAERLRNVIEPHLGAEQRIILDMSDVTFVDSSCLHVLEHARGRLTAD